MDNLYNLDKDKSPILRHAVAITPDDDAVINPPYRSIYVGGTGDLVLVLSKGDDPVTFTDIPAGTQIMLQVYQVKEATDATDLIGLW